LFQIVFLHGSIIARAAVANKVDYIFDPSLNRVCASVNELVSIERNPPKLANFDQVNFEIEGVPIAVKIKLRDGDCCYQQIVTTS
jgi:hypothetical protein